MQIVEVPTHGDEERGFLSVVDGLLPFDIKRVLYIYGVQPDGVRGGHGHKTTFMALICLGGSCKVSIYPLGTDDYEEVILDAPTKCVILAPEDWHTMSDFTAGSILIVISSEHHAEEDYVYDRF